MARRCTCCGHAEADALDLALLTSSNRVVAGQFRVSQAAVDRHRREHLPARVEASRALLVAVDAAAGVRRLATMKRGEMWSTLLDRLDEAHAAARAAGDCRAQIVAVDATARLLTRAGVTLRDGRDAAKLLVDAADGPDRAEIGATMLHDMAAGFLASLREIDGEIIDGIAEELPVEM